MSYNSSTQYSPYYQSHGNNYQTTSTLPQTASNHYQDDSRLNNSYSNGSYQPLSTYQSDYQRQQQQEQEQNSSAGTGYNRNTYNSQSYDNLPASSAEQNISSSYTTSRQDTSSLGNLAYASSLGQNSQPSLAQLIEYNRARSSGGYTDNGSYGNNSSLQRNESAGQPSYGNQQNLPTKTLNPPSQTYNNQSYQRTDLGLNNTGRSSPAQYQYSNPSQPQQASHQPISDSNQFSAQSNSAALPQSMPRPASRTNRQSVQSPQTNAESGPQYGQQNGVTNNHARSSSQNTQTLYRPSPSATPATNKTSPKPPTYSFARSSKTNSQTPSNKDGLAAPKTVTTIQTSRSKPSGARAQTIGRTEQQSPQLDANAPTTVDPSQVFNNYEYQRRQSEFNTARKEAGASSKSTANARGTGSKKTQPQSSPPADDVTQAARALMGQSGASSADTPTKELFENEMKAMIEKMRDYKAQNPGLFSQVWEEVKQGTPTQIEAAKAPSPAAKAVQNGQPASPEVVELPAESDLETSAFPPGFDRGRYPKERRRRGNAQFKPESSKQNHKKKFTGELNQQWQKFAPSAIDPSLVETPKEKPKKKAKSTEQASQQQPPQTYNSPANQVPEPAPYQAPPASGGTFWPEDKKRALAEAAVESMKAIPANSGKSIDPDEIHNVLNGNPSYNDLCQYLERRGFIVSRGAFARQLLTAVPGTAPKEGQAQSAPASAPQAYPQPGYQAPVGFMSPAQMTVSGPYAPIPPHYSAGEAPIKPEVKFVPLTKEEKARKRNISDIVDLTAFAEEDEFLRHRPKPRIEPPKPPAPKPEVAARDSLSNVSDSGLMNGWRLPQPPGSGPVPKLQSLGQTAPQGNPKEHLLYEMVAEPMIKRRDALRRSKYDSRSIARDVLLGTGIHPTLKSLNQHLDILKDRFISIDVNTDLSTFRWDLVDPGGVPGPKPVSELMKEWQEKKNQHSAEGSVSRSDKDEFEGDAYGDAPQATASKQAPRRQPQSENVVPGPLPGPIPGPKRRGRPPKYRPSDIQPLGKTKPTAPSLSSNAEPSQTYSSPFPAVDSQSTPPPKPNSPSQPDFAEGPLTSLSFASVNGSASKSATHPRPTIESDAHSSTSTPVRVPGRRGRPPGAKNRQPRSDKGIPKKRDSGISNLSPATPSTSTQNKPETEAPSSFPPSRPSGLRNVMTPTSTSKSVSVIIPSRSPSVANASPSSTRRGSASNQVKTESGGTHNPTPFKCLWEGCGAEYPQIEQLRRHLRKVHREDVSAVGPWLCLWADCYDPLSRTRPRPDSSSGSEDGESDDYGDEDEEGEWERDRLSFEEADRWDRHVERRHIAQYLPGAGFIDLDETANSPYMSDPSGRRVTPLASPSPGPSDPLPMNTDPQVITEYHKAHDIDTDEEKQEVLARALTAKKEKVGGIGMYKTGVRLVGQRKRLALARGAAEVGGEVGEVERGGAGEESDEDVEMDSN